MDEARHLYDQIAKRTAGSIYIGVVGPVRTGKSTFIKRFMEQLVLPHLENTYQRDRARDELPAVRLGADDHDDGAEICAGAGGGNFARTACQSSRSG